MMVLLSLLCLLPSARATFAPRSDPADLGKELLAGRNEKLPEELFRAKKRSSLSRSGRK
jgi:hypothetical protein